MARANLQIKVGKYVGNVTDNTNITGIGFAPQFVAVKAGSAQNSVFRTKEMRGDSTGFLTSSNANLSDRIQFLLPDGFQVGTAGQVNTNLVNYYYFAVKGASSQSYFRTGNYTGNGSDNRDFTDTTVNFVPNLAIIQKYVTGQTCVWRTSSMSGDITSQFTGATSSANIIQNLQSNGFQLGTDATVNTSAAEYVYILMKTFPGAMQIGTYTGTGVSQSITGIGFKPDLVIVKNKNTTDAARMLTTDMVTDSQNSVFMDTTASDATGITSLDTDGFTVSTGASVNGSTNTIYWLALKSGNFNVPFTRLTS